MHELPVVIDIVKVMDEEAEKHGYAKISEINLVIGELSSIMDESVQMYFEVVAKGKPCEKAKLNFEHIPAMLKCQKCGKEFPHIRKFECPYCGGDGFLVKGTGREFYIKSYDGE